MTPSRWLRRRWPTRRPRTAVRRCTTAAARSSTGPADVLVASDAGLRGEEHDGSSAGQAQGLGPAAQPTGLLVQTGVVRAQPDHDDIAEGTGIGPRLQYRHLMVHTFDRQVCVCVVQHQRPAPCRVRRGIASRTRATPTLLSTAAAQPTRERALMVSASAPAINESPTTANVTAIRAAVTDGGEAGESVGGGRLGKPPACHRVSGACRGDADHGLVVLHRGGCSGAERGRRLRACFR